jgi:AbrB family looped-hinge helix DNA binding protein
MDAAGRLVLPKAVREQYGIANGAHQLEVSDTSDGIVLRPKGETAALVREAGGWMVFQADEEASADSIDPVAVVDEARSARSRVVTGEA